MITRRQFSALLIGAGAACITPYSVFADISVAKNKSIALRSIHTGESGSFNYVVNGKIVEKELERINYLLRDHRTGDIHNIDIKLIEQLYQLQSQHGSNARFDVISGYRSPKTNAALRNKSNGVAKKSYHMKGQAIDIAMPGVDVSTLLKQAKALKAGGVGFYKKSGFIHLDTGPVRSW